MGQSWLLGPEVMCGTKLMHRVEEGPLVLGWEWGEHDGHGHEQRESRMWTRQRLLPRQILQ